MVNQLTVGKSSRSGSTPASPTSSSTCGPIEERATAKIEGVGLPRRRAANEPDRRSSTAIKTIVFFCHHGMRSQQAASHLLASGFRDVHNLQGGIDAWAMHIDPDVARY